VLPAEPPLRAGRLVLADLTGRTLAQGLELLGIRVVERM
jgi:arginyl-tRNA synthetase